MIRLPKEREYLEVFGNSNVLSKVYLYLAQKVFGEVSSNFSITRFYFTNRQDNSFKTDPEVKTKI